MPVLSFTWGIAEDVLRLKNALSNLQVASGALPLFRRPFAAFCILKSRFLRPGEWGAYSAQPEHYEVYINPVVLASSQPSLYDWESCVCLGSTRVGVKRSIYVEVAYTDMQLNRQKRLLKGFEARLFQHEMDHLQGVTMFDHAHEDPLACVEDGATNHFEEYVQRSPDFFCENPRLTFAQYLRTVERKGAPSHRQQVQPEGLPPKQALPL